MKRKLALPDRILMKIEKPARYTGGEINSVMKDKDQISVRFAMCFPDVYEIGMSHLGIQILYSMLNEREDVWCERVYSPWMDLHRIMKEEEILLYALESQDPVKAFDFLGITLQYEMCYTNILQILDLSGIPFRSCERSDQDPIVIGGGPCAYNPEPIAEFFDLFYIGEGETVYFDLIDLYKDFREKGKSRREFLEAASGIRGIYVPSLYRTEYAPDGTISAFEPVPEGVPARVSKQACENLDLVSFPDAPVIPYVQATQDRVTLEIQRGCIRGCRFCQAGMIYRPFRTRSLEFLKQHAQYMIENTGYEEISLSSLSSSDYPQLLELLDFLIETYEDRKVNISLPSLRIDEFPIDVMNKVQDIRKSSLTFAPEAGTQRMRDVINKGITEENIFTGAANAFSCGWNKVKLYFMLGLPTEREEDIKGISSLAERIAELYYDTVPKEQRKGKIQITVSTSFFVPKPFTPFQWEPMLPPEQYLEKAYLLNETIRTELNKKSIKYNWHDAKTTIIEGLLARGDRRISRVIEKVYEDGGVFDAWTEYFDYDRWIRALEASGLSLSFYLYRRRSLDEILPWDFIDAGPSKSFMVREYKRALEEKITPNCKAACCGCGAAAYKGGEYCPCE
ncbi:MAG: TIGR03960 family B12-binding radical SAM protein [Parasporobacterium sp.]|nr:TIGR03960 family B12-binding radical SAM protein [Parasporobacterium sp.]